MARITHTEIAQAAGVSRSTVSRALKNHPALPSATCKRIQLISEKLGYKPNPLVSALMASRRSPGSSTSASTLAIIITWAKDSTDASSDTYKRLLKGAVNRAKALGFGVETISLEDQGMTDQRIDQILYSRGIVALLFAPIPSGHPDINLNWDHFSVGTIGSSRQIPAFNRVSHFHFLSIPLALREIIKLGYRRPGLVLSHEIHHQVLGQWIGAIEAEMGLDERSTIQRVPPYIHHGVKTRDLQKWIETTRPDVLISNDWALESELIEAQHPMPVATLDWVPRFNHLSGIDQLHEVIGSAAVDLVTAQLYRNERGVPAHPKHILIEGVWRHGKSCPAVY